MITKQVVRKIEKRKTKRKGPKRKAKTQATLKRFGSA
jgi:hypothetical protein